MNDEQRPKGETPDGKSTVQESRRYSQYVSSVCRSPQQCGLYAKASLQCPEPDP